MNWGNSARKRAPRRCVASVFPGRGARLGAPLAILFFLLVPGFAQQRPLLTEDPRLIPYGAAVTELGFGYSRRAHFPLSGLTGDQYSVLVNGLNFGLGPRAQFQMNGVAQNFLRVREGGSGWRNDWGDLSLSTKIKIVDET